VSPTTEYADLSAGHDWTVLDLPYVESKCALAARAVATATTAQNLMDFDDLYQEAVTLCAANAEKVRGYVSAGELGHLYTWLSSRVMNAVRTEVARSSRSISYEVARESWGQ
jgi:hypothetical protein